MTLCSSRKLCASALFFLCSCREGRKVSSLSRIAISPSGPSQSRRNHRLGRVSSVPFRVGFHTLAVWTPKNFFPLLMRPQGSQGCQKITFIFLQMKLFSFCAKKMQTSKTIKNEEKMLKKNPVFLDFF